MAELFKDNDRAAVQGAFRHGVAQIVAYTGTAANSASFAATTKVIRVMSMTDARVAVGPTVLISATNAIAIPAKTPVFLQVEPGWRLQVTTLESAANGNLYINELV